MKPVEISKPCGNRASNAIHRATFPAWRQKSARTDLRINCRIVRIERR